MDRFNQLSRRAFIGTLSGAAMALGSGCSSNGSSDGGVKPIRGSWFEFQHHNQAEGVYWNPTVAEFTAKDWALKVKEMADIGLEYLVLMCTALHFKAFYPTDIFPPYGIRCEDPVEAVLAAGDLYGVKFFMGGGFYGKWDSPRIIEDPDAARLRLKAIGELAEKYAHHKSFYGWYWPNEAFINKYYSDRFIDYVNACSAEAGKVTPDAKTLIAPYGTRVAVPDDRYVKQLESMDVDIIAYQDEIGVQKTQVSESAAFFEGLRTAHDRVQKAAMWADMEIFEFEGQVYRSPLIPASFDRIEGQMAAVSPYVDVILIYQYLGMMNKPGSKVFAGHRESDVLYGRYVEWLRKNHPKLLRN